MDRLPPAALQPIAARIAGAICAADEAQVRALHADLAKLMPPEPEPPQRAAGAQPLPGPDRIGIWGRESGEGQSPYRRLDKHRSHWRLWADVDEIPANCPGRRIVWLGESAARGYFYDPVFAPAIVLQDLLRQAPALSDLEVVDLARSNIDPGGILEVAARSLRLKPDLFILFAGNNWCAPELYDAPARRQLRSGTRCGRLPRICRCHGSMASRTNRHQHGPLRRDRDERRCARHCGRAQIQFAGLARGHGLAGPRSHGRSQWPMA